MRHEYSTVVTQSLMLFVGEMRGKKEVWNRVLDVVDVTAVPAGHCTFADLRLWLVCSEDCIYQKDSYLDQKRMQISEQLFVLWRVGIFDLWLGCWQAVVAELLVSILPSVFFFQIPNIPDEQRQQVHSTRALEEYLRQTRGQSRLPAGPSPHPCTAEERRSGSVRTCVQHTEQN